MKRTSSYIERIARIVLAEDDYQYIYDPEHRNKPHGTFFETEKGWSNDPKDAPQQKAGAYPYKLTPLDNEYFEAVKSNDSAKLQKMVEARAREAGYNSPIVKHGTASGHMVFDKKMGGSITDARSAKKAFFFSDDDKTALAYATYASEEGPIKEALAKAELAEKKGDWDGYEKYIIEAEALDTYDKRLERRKKSRVINGYLSGKFDIFDAEGKSPQELSEDGDIDSGLTGLIDRARRKGFTGIIMKNLDDAVGLNRQPANHYVVFQPNQIKLSDTVVKDDAGNIIPLSQRFNPKSNDIRF